ncbi:MAG: decarboxylase, partial [Dehalococcoidia bacterium]|nr:decarboxylase [Dehalococcoidia bacterium]
SENGITQSAGIMINYLYELTTIDRNHENYANTKEILASEAIHKLNV